MFHGRARVFIVWILKGIERISLFIQRQYCLGTEVSPFLSNVFRTCEIPFTKLLPIFSDPVVNSNSNERSSVKSLLEKLILEEDQFDVRDILPNTIPDPSSLVLESDYACPVGQVVMAPDCGK